MAREIDLSPQHPSFIKDGYNYTWCNCCCGYVKEKIRK